MGDYRNHQSETGAGLCNSFEMVVKLGRAELGDDLQQLELELKLFEHYSQLYINHQNSVKFGKEKLRQIRHEIDILCSQQKLYGYSDFQFLIEMANLSVQARRTISYTYVIRYYIRGRNKQQFFDFLLQELERDLEKLTKRTEENWLSYTDTDEDLNVTLCEKFFAYKQDLISLRSALENHFKNCLESIQNGLPEVDDEEDFNTKEIVFFKKTWTCRLCKLHFLDDVLQCSNCKANKPEPVRLFK